MINIDPNMIKVPDANVAVGVPVGQAGSINAVAPADEAKKLSIGAPLSVPGGDLNSAREDMESHRDLVGSADKPINVPSIVPTFSVTPSAIQRSKDEQKELDTKMMD